MRITVLWSALASYSVAFFRALAEEQNCELQLIYQTAKAEAPYRSFNLRFCAQAVEESPARRSDLWRLIEGFSPECVLMSSWGFRRFMKICRRLRRDGVFVVASMDNQWYGTLKQRLGVLMSPLFLKPCIDTFVVAGDRQAWFARRLGFSDVLYGFYSGETAKFTNACSMNMRAREFLFVGRLVNDKGIDLLRDAYRLYRQRATDPWDLKVVGTGALRPLLEGMPGVGLVGFLQPEALPQVMANAGCFVLSSRWEHWGVVIHEAAAAGLPIIATDECGAVTMFVRDGVNGYITACKAEALARAMQWISEKSNEELDEMRSKSLTLANLWTPSMLARYFVENVTHRIRAEKVAKG